MIIRYQQPSLSGTKQSDFFLKEAQLKQSLERQSSLVETSLGNWARVSNKCDSEKTTITLFRFFLLLPKLKIFLQI